MSSAQAANGIQTRLTVKAYKSVEWASEATECFTATLYLDGKRIGTVENNGRGGDNYYHFNTREDSQAFYDYVKEWQSLPEVQSNPDYQIQGEFFAGEATLVSEACDDYRREREMKKALKNYETVLRIERPEPGSMVRVLTTLLPKGYDVNSEIVSESEKGDKVFIYTRSGGVEAR